VGENMVKQNLEIGKTRLESERTLRNLRKNFVSGTPLDF
jgi:hypothetical protein